MSVQAGPIYKRYTANGIATVYAIPFKVMDAGDLQITLNGVLVTSGFTLGTLGGDSTSCTFAVAPIGDLLFQLVLPFQRLTDYQTNGDLLAKTINNDLDRIWLALKQLTGGNDRSLATDISEPEGVGPLPLKAPRALKVLGFDSDGNPVVTTLTMAQLEAQPALAMDAANAAAISAAAAALSEGNALASAIAAANSYDAFDDRYLGAKSSDPTLDNDGNALITGAIYWNTASSRFRVWNGTNWQDQNTADFMNAPRINVASAAAVNLTASAPNTRNINITGTTTITSFVIPDGLVYLVRFNASLTLTNNANIVTQSGANIVTQAGDTCWIRATALNVVEVLAYTPFKNQALGYEQTLQNMTGSRAAATTYTNNTGKTIWVVVSGAGGAANAQTTLTVNGSVVDTYQAYAATSIYSLKAPVPPGGTYSLTGSVGGITYWMEIRT